MKYLKFALCAVVFGFTAAYCHASEPIHVNSLTKPMFVSTLCDCPNGGVCACSPENCNCPGCPKHASTVSVSTSAEESELPQIPRFPVQYQQQCINGKCTLVPVTQSMPVSAPVGCANGSCATGNCAPMQMSGGCASGNCGSMQGGSGRSFQPVRRVFGIFRGRGGRGCRGCGG